METVALFAERLCPRLSQPYARYTQCKTAHKHSFLVQKHTYDRKERALSSLQCLQSTLHMDKTGNRTASKRCATRLTERSHSLSYRTRVLLTHDRVLPGVPSRKGTANERATGPLPCGCKSLATINMASLYLEYSSKLEAISLQVKAKQAGRLDARQLQNVNVTRYYHASLLGQRVAVCSLRDGELWSWGTHTTAFSAKSCPIHRVFHRC